VTAAEKGGSAWRQPVFWLVVGLPALSVVMATVYAVIAFRVFDGVVEDDYYRRGRAINRVLKRDQLAEALGMRADLRLDEATGDVTLRLAATGAAELPAVVRLELFHATRAGADRRLEMRRVAEGVYAGRIEPLPPGRYNVQAETDAWRIVGQLRAPAGAACGLAPST
jgi:hypothetical protein